MASAKWSLDAHVDAPPEDVYAWMTDFRVDDHSRPAFKRGAGIARDEKRAAKRAVVARQGNTVTLEDTWGRQKYRTTAELDPARRTVTIRGEFGYRASWSATPERGGTRVTFEGEMAPGGLFGLLMPLFAKSALKQTEQDFRGHIADLEESVAKR